MTIVDLLFGLGLFFCGLSGGMIIAKSLHDKAYPECRGSK